MMFHVYSRVSTIEQAKGISIEDQQRQGSQLADWMGVDKFDRTYWPDKGVSGTIPLSKRPSGGLMWAGLAPGDWCVATKLDRMFRNSRDALNMIDCFAEKKVSLVLL